MSRMFKEIDKILKDIPATLSEELACEFDSVKVQYLSECWEQVLTSAGRFCEVVYSILNGKSISSYPAHASKPRNFQDACEKLSNSSLLTKSERTVMPRVLVAIYTFRNKRNGGHIDGAIRDFGEYDATAVIGMVKWVLTELLRNFGGDSQSSQKVIEQINENWDVVWTAPDGMARMSYTGVSVSNQTLILLARAKDGSLPVKQLILACDYKNSTRYRGTILGDLAKKKFLFISTDEDKAYIMPAGRKKVNEISRSLS